MGHETTSPGRKCLCCGACGPGRAGQRLSPGQAFAHGEKKGEKNEAVPRERPHGETWAAAFTASRVRVPLPPENQMYFLPLESPAARPAVSLMYFFWPNPVPGNFSLGDQTFPPRDKGHNLSHLKTTQLSEGSVLQRLQMPVNFRILCGLRKSFSGNCPTLIRRLWFPASITAFL